jgi:hypothetical protein
MALLSPGAAVERDPVGRHRGQDILDLLRPEIVVGDVELAAHQVVDIARDQDAAGLGQGLQAGGDIHAFAEQIAVIEHHIAEIDADTIAELAGLGCRPGAELALHLDRAEHRLDHAAELRQKPVARGVDDAPLMALDQGGEQAARGLELVEGADFVGLHQAAIAGDVRRENRRQLAADPGTLGHHSSLLAWSARYLLVSSASLARSRDVRPSRGNFSRDLTAI